MLTLEATKNQKMVFGIIALIVTGYVIYRFMISTAYHSYSENKAKEKQLSTQITEHYQKLVRLQQLRKQYLQDAHFLKQATEQLSIDVADLLSLLTKNSPVRNFTHAYLEKQKKKIEESGIIQYPFEIEFQSDFQKIGEYLLYQESSLPISLIENIVVEKIADRPDMLKTKINGVIYKVE